MVLDIGTEVTKFRAPASGKTKCRFPENSLTVSYCKLKTDQIQRIDEDSRLRATVSMVKYKMLAGQTQMRPLNLYY